MLIGLKKEENEEVYIPKSFRVKGNIFDRADASKCILSKVDKEGLYDNVLYKDNVRLETVDENILCKIDVEIIKSSRFTKV